MNGIILNKKVGKEMICKVYNGRGSRSSTMGGIWTVDLGGTFKVTKVYCSGRVKQYDWSGTGPVKLTINDVDYTVYNESVSASGEATFNNVLIEPNVYTSSITVTNSYRGQSTDSTVCTAIFYEE